MKRINAEIIITGTGDIIQDGTIVYEDGEITYLGDQGNAPAVEDTRDGYVVMPGMWDCHGHFLGMNDLNFEKQIFTPDLVSGMRTVPDAQAALLAGFTSVREVGGYGLYLKQTIEEGTILGPRIYAAGAALSMTGGHGDMHSLPLDLMHKVMEQDHQWFAHVDGVAECLKGVRKQLRKGAEVIKVMVSGGVLSEIDDPIHQQFSFDELKAIVDEAHRSEVAVAAHCHGIPGMKNALDAGVDTIEHGTYLNEELAEQMAEQGTILVPTRTIVEESMRVIDSPAIPEYGKEKMRRTAELHEKALQVAIKAGVTIACGTDIAGSTLSNFNKWGTNARELEHYVNAGMTEMEAVICATANGPKTLGGRAPKSGMLQVGYEADILVLNKNPLDDIKLLQDREIFDDIIKAGISYLRE